MPTSPEPGSRGPAGRRDPVRPATPTQHRNARHPDRTAGRSAHRTTAGRNRSRHSDSTLPDSTLPDSTLPDSTLPDSTLPDSTLLPGPTLPTTVWLLTTPTCPTPDPAGGAERSETPIRPGDHDAAVLDAAVAEIVGRAVDAFLPTVRQSRHASVLVRVIRHARGLRDTAPRTPTAPDTTPPGTTPPDITPPWGETGPHHGAASTEIDAAHGAPLGSRVGVGLLLLDATRTTAAATAETPVLDDAVTALAPGGVLAVLTTSDRIAGWLRDPRPALIDAARAAGLDYWQHIVTATHPATRPDGEPRTGRTPRHREHTASHRAHADGGRDGSNDEDGPARRSWSLVADISVFRRPALPDLPAGVDPGRADLPDQDATTTEVQP